MSYDERPDGWGICSICGEDCADEADYNAATRTSTHRACDNLEPPEPDGEAFRGGEAEAFAAEQQMAARRLK